MTKLVEEAVINSDVLVDVLVQVGFLDKAFEDGNVSRIDSSYGREGANTYSITVEKEVSLNSIENLSSEQLMKAKEVSNKIDEGRSEYVPQYISPLEFVFKILSNEDGQGIDTEKLEKLIKERLSSNFNIK